MTRDCINIDYDPLDFGEDYMMFEFDECIPNPELYGLTPLYNYIIEDGSHKDNKSMFQKLKGFS